MTEFDELAIMVRAKVAEQISKDVLAWAARPSDAVLVDPPSRYMQIIMRLADELLTAAEQDLDDHAGE